MAKTQKRFLRASLIFIGLEGLAWLVLVPGITRDLLTAILILVWLAELRRIVHKSLVIEFTVKAKPVQPSLLVTRYLDKQHGIEIGASTQNSYQLPRAINVDFADNPGTWQNSKHKPATVHLVANGDDLPFKDATLDFVLSSHNIEHYFDPIKALQEWWRVIRPGGYIIAVVPHKERTFDRHKDETSLAELISRHKGDVFIQDYVYKRTDASANQKQSVGYEGSETAHQLCRNNEPVPAGWTRYQEDDHHHWCIWRTEGFLELCEYLQLPVIEYQDRDDKVGNGFTVVIQKPASAASGNSIKTSS